MPNGAERRRALRIAIYINLLEHDPISFNHGSYGIYEFALLEQFAKLGQRVGHKRATEVRKKGDALVARQGLIPTVLELFGTERPEHLAAEAIASTTEAVQFETAPVRSGEEKRIEKQMCRRKLRHPNFLSALTHASRLNESGLNIYGCPFCHGLHVGHSMTGHVPRDRRIKRRLQELALTLNELDKQRAILSRERRALMRERTELIATAIENS